MSSIQKDSRFSRVLTDPRFLPMPSFEKKVKIDKRFKALFTSDDFGHIQKDKRGRPIHDVSKRGKHVMEEFYQLPSDDSSSDEEESDSDDDDDVDEDGDGRPQKVKSDFSSSGSDVVEKKKPQRRKNNFDQEHDDDDEEEEPQIKKTKKPLKRKNNLDQSDDDDAEPQTKKTKKGQKSKTEKFSDSDQDSEDADEEEEEEDDEEDDESSESEEDDSSDDEELPEYSEAFDIEDTMVDHKWNERHTEAPSVAESTHRLAVCNMDWDFIKAQDLFVLFKSFAGEGGAVRSVSIYQSEFGKERMAEEAVLGPKEMRDKLKSGNDGDDSQKKRIKDQQLLKRMEKQMVRDEHIVLREYQLNRMRYYYAVVDCNTAQAADNIYKECDGQEYQLSSVKLDLRFIPDDMTFDDEPRESFSENQALIDYTPRLFNSTALSQSKVDVTWDETEFDRLHKKMVHMQRKELESIVEENQYADIIAPPESDSDLDDDGRPQWLKSVLEEGDEEEEEIDEEKKISLYRKVLMDKLVKEEEKEKRDNEIDKELDWKLGLKSEVENKLEKKKKTEGTIVDDYLEKQKEKKRKKRLKKKARLAKAEEEEEEDYVPGIIDDQLKEMMQDEGVDLDSLKGKKKRKQMLEEEENNNNSDDEREKAELELLMMGDADEKMVAKPEKVEEGKLSRRQKTKKKLLARQQKKKEAEEQTIDTNDPRFEAMFTSHHFHIDPSAPEFSKTPNMMKYVDEQIRRKPKLEKEKKLPKGEEKEGDSQTVSKKLVESLKRKMKK